VIVIKSPEEIQRIGDACRIVAEVLEVLRDSVTEGITTRELERMAEDTIIKKGGTPAFKGYRGYPATLCTSVNDQVVHGIPSETKLRSGDIISMDVGVRYNGFYGDAAVTLPVGKIGGDVENLLRITEESLYLGVDIAHEGNRISDISYAIQGHVEKNGYSVVREFVGHGIGKQLHEEPQIPNFGPPGRGERLRSGMTLAIEPMVNAGGHQVRVLKDGWTAVTADGSLSAHYEHTVAITGDGARVLTTTG
jgi:methionyl aminopeptidase